MDKPRRRRLFTGMGLFFAMLLLFLGQLIRLQVVEGKAYFAQTLQSLTRQEIVPAARGDLLDRNGALLVGNQVSYRVTLSLSDMGSARNETLLSLLELTRAEGLSWWDTLPITSGAPYRYTTDQIAEAQRSRFEAYLAALDLSLPERPQALLLQLAEHYGLPDALDPETRRSLLGVLYECDLRTRQLSWSEYAPISEAPLSFLLRVRELGLPGVTLTPQAARVYETDAAAHVLGRVGPMSQAEWERYQLLGYDMDALVGKEGAEQAFESWLHGTKGTLRQTLDDQGAVLSREYSQEPQPGSHVRLTLDRSLQEKTEEILAESLRSFPQAEGAAVVILDVNTGGVLTLCSSPTYTPSSFTAAYSRLLEDPLRPLYNRAIQGTYAPGSTFKLVTAIAALEEGIITPETEILDTGRYTYYRTPQPLCWIYRETGKTHGTETVSQAITDSCNVFFYDVGRRLGIEALTRWAGRLGLGTTTGIELSGEGRGVVAGPSYTTSLGEVWYEGSTLSAAIGQENNRFTPLQLASFMATLVNGGNRWQTHLLQEVYAPDGTLLHRQEPVLLDHIALTPAYVEAVKTGMAGVTESAAQARYFQDLPVRVGAKTGSAQVTGKREANAVFLCFAPYDNPEIALALVVEQGGSGSELGAIAAEILKAYFVPDTAEETAEGAEIAGQIP